MQTYIWKDGQQQGPYTPSELDELLKAEAITADTLFWQEGRADWEPLSQFPGFIASPSPTPPAAALGGTALHPGPATKAKKRGVAVLILATVVLCGCAVALFLRSKSQRTKPSEQPSIVETAPSTQPTQVPADTPPLAQANLVEAKAESPAPLAMERPVGSETQPAAEQEVQAMPGSESTPTAATSANGAQPSAESSPTVLPPDEIIIRGMKQTPYFKAQKFRRGTTLASQGIGGIPVDTPLYPVKFDDYPGAVYFFQDEFDDWKLYFEGLNGPIPIQKPEEHPVAGAPNSTPGAQPEQSSAGGNLGGPPREIVIGDGAVRMIGNAARTSFRRGSVQESRGIANIPEGTPLYPVKFEGFPLPLYYFQDEFEDWKLFIVQPNGNPGPVLPCK